jgi:hypothetical protein
MKISLKLLDAGFKYPRDLGEKLTWWSTGLVERFLELPSNNNSLFWLAILSTPSWIDSEEPPSTARL